MKKRVSLLLAFVLVFGITFMNVPQANAATKKQVSITLNKSNYTLAKGKTLKLKATVKNKKKAKVVFKSSKKSVATVSKNGKVTAKKKGTAVITATVSGTKKKAKCTIRVGTPVKKVTVPKKSIQLKKGATYKIKAKVTPTKATVKTFTYKSSNSKIAKVSKSGTIKAVKVGSTKVTVVTKDGTGKKATITVKVVKAAATSTAVSSVTINASEKAMFLDDTCQLTASVKPQNATNKAIHWSSDNAAVASVDGNGLVTAHAGGSANITAKADNGVSATCRINVAPTKKVSTQAQLESALNNNLAESILIETNEKVDFKIPEGNYATKTLVVNAPNADVINNGNFARVQIYAIATNSYYENQTGNNIDFMSANGRIVVSNNASATINVNPGASNVTVDNAGNVNVNINTGSNVNIQGSSKLSSNVQINSSDVTFQTKQEAKVVASAKFNFIVDKGGENSTVTVNSAANIPNVSGIGRIPVSITDTNDQQIVMAESNPGLELPTVTLNGVVKVADTQEAIQGASIYLLPYNATITPSNVDTYYGTALGSTSTDSEGMYGFNNIKVGNYILVASANGKKKVLQTVSILSDSNSEVTALRMDMVDVSEVGNGNISGKVRDAKNLDGLSSGIKLRIREGIDTQTGTVVQEVMTNDNGEYSFENLPAGYYTIQAIDTRQLNGAQANYALTSVIVRVKAGQTIEQDVVLSALESNQMRIVLTWGDEASGAPSDLDSHLTGPTAEGMYNFHTYYGDQEYVAQDANGNQITYAALDVDDTEYVGPETTTIYFEVSGNYNFYVRDFTNRSCEGSSTQLANSSAKVQVYYGNNLIRTYNVPNQEGTLWHVFDYDSVTKTFKTINEMSYFTGSEQFIGLDKRQIAIRNCSAEINQAEDILSRITLNKEALQNKVDEAKSLCNNASSEVSRIEAVTDELIELYSKIYKTYVDYDEVSLIDGIDIRCYSDGDIYLEAMNEQAVRPNALVINGKTYDIQWNSETSSYGYIDMTNEVYGYSYTLYIYYDNYDND
ncbi:protein containing cell adhesion domain [Lachnospiraceae bacterium KM106-2]|nr:protein containing cell adhesion domain [Lachnospiraceae bacterium KM106-2]